MNENITQDHVTYETRSLLDEIVQRGVQEMLETIPLAPFILTMNPIMANSAYGFKVFFRVRTALHVI